MTIHIYYTHVSIYYTINPHARSAQVIMPNSAKALKESKQNRAPWRNSPVSLERHGDFSYRYRISW